MNPSKEKSAGFDLSNGGSPRITVDPRMLMVTNQSRDNPQKYPQRFMLSNEGENFALAIVAVEHVYPLCQPAFPYVELIRIRFSANVDAPNDSPIMHVTAVFADPASDAKPEVTVLIKIQSGGLPADFDKRKERIMERVTAEFIAGRKVLFNQFRAGHAQVLQRMQQFDTLFR